MRLRPYSCYILIGFFSVLSFLSVRAVGAAKAMPWSSSLATRTQQQRCALERVALVTVSGGTHPRSFRSIWFVDPESNPGLSAEPTGPPWEVSAPGRAHSPDAAKELMDQEGKPWDRGEQCIELLLLPGADPETNEGPHFITGAQVFTCPAYQIFIIPIDQWLPCASCPLFQVMVCIGVTLSLLFRCIVGIRWRQQLPLHW